MMNGKEAEHVKHGKVIRITRDTILGKGEEGKPRPGRMFAENGMHVYDVEVLDVRINNTEIAGMLLSAQHKAVKNTLSISGLEQDLILEKKSQWVKRGWANEIAETALNDYAIEKKRFEEETSLESIRTQRAAVLAKAKAAAELAMNEVMKSLVAAEIERNKTKTDAEIVDKTRRHEFDLLRNSQCEYSRLGFKAQEAEIVTKSEAAAAAALATKLNGFSDKLVAALQAFADKDLAIKVAEAMAPLAILRDDSVANSFVQMARGTNLENIFDDVLLRLASPEKKSMTPVGGR
jgi:major vault protein